MAYSRQVELPRPLISTVPVRTSSPSVSTRSLPGYFTSLSWWIWSRVVPLRISRRLGRLLCRRHTVSVLPPSRVRVTRSRSAKAPVRVPPSRSRRRQEAAVTLPLKDRTVSAGLSSWGRNRYHTPSFSDWYPWLVHCRASTVQQRKSLSPAKAVAVSSTVSRRAASSAHSQAPDFGSLSCIFLPSERIERLRAILHDKRRCSANYTLL